MFRGARADRHRRGLRLVDPAAGHVHHNGMRLIRLGELHGGADRPAAADRAGVADAGFNVRAFEDIDRMIWEKFLCNVT